MKHTRSTVSTFIAIACLCCLGLRAAAADLNTFVDKALREPVLKNAGMTTFDAVFDMVKDADTAADKVFLDHRSERSLRRHQRRLRESWTKSFGGYPKRTPLNARVTGVVPRDGYRIEKVLFESLPGLFVTAHLFLPDEIPDCKPPYPGILICCGHSGEGKGIAGYQRAAVLAALDGFAALIYDPIDQGERLQLPGKNPPHNVHGHNITGISAMLLGWNTARFRIWDGMRALDYMQSRKEINPKRLGVMGNSGGGTLSSYIMALDDRIGSGAPSCYITSLTELCDRCGPQDAEQNFFGQLAFGINHAGFVMARAPSPVCINCTHGDFFPFDGTKKTFAVAQDVFKRFGWDERIAMLDVPGPHGWQEGTRSGSVQWMRRWLKNDAAALPLDLDRLRKISAEFNDKQSDCGLVKENAWVTETGQVRDLPGARSVYDIMRDELTRIEKRRKSHSQKKLRGIVRSAAGVRAAEKIPFERSLVSVKEHADIKEIRQVFSFPSGIKLPAVSLIPGNSTAAPVLIVAGDGKSNHVHTADKYLAAGHPVMAADITGTGEIGGFKHKFYGSDHLDEGVGQMLYLLGKSLVGTRAEDIIACAKSHSEACGNASVIICAGTSTIVAAYHAYAAEPQLFNRIDTISSLPLAWGDVVRKSDRYSFSDCVQNGLRFYDWIDLYTPPPKLSASGSAKIESQPAQQR